MNSLRSGLLAIAAILSGTASLHAQSMPAGVVRITIDVTKQRHAINPLIYGVNFGTTKQLVTLRAPLNRQGGSAAEVYDYKSRARNAGKDWFYESALVDRKDILQLPPEDFIALTQRAGADSMITIPLIGWVAKLGPNNSKLASFSITKYGLQKATDEKWMPEAGNGVRLDGTAIHNDPNDAMQPDTPAREAAFV
ncbi:MAG: glycoside hydrolase family 44 protein, partial [Terriglobus sp.]